MISKFLSTRTMAAALIGGGVVLGTATMALAYSGSSQGYGDSRTEALSDAYRSAESVCRSGTDEAPSYSSKDCSRRNSGYKYICVVTYRCR